MKPTTDNSLSFAILLTIFLLCGWCFYLESKKRIYRPDVISKKVTITSFHPTYSEFSDTDDIKIEVVEFPEKVFELSYLGSDYKKSKELLADVEFAETVIIDIEKQHFLKKINQKPFLGIQPSISLLGVRTSEDTEIPLLDYNVKVVGRHSLTYFISFIGAGFTIIMWSLEINRNRRLKKVESIRDLD